MFCSWKYFNRIRFGQCCSSSPIKTKSESIQRQRVREAAKFSRLCRLRDTARLDGMMRLRLLLTICVLLVACDSGPIEAQPELVCTQESVPGVLMPLEIGNYWDIEAQKGNGEVVDTFRTQITTKLDPATYGIEQAYVAEDFNLSSPNDIKKRLIWKNEIDGLLLAGLISGEDTVLYNFRKYPLSPAVGQEIQSYRVGATGTQGVYERVDSTKWTVFKTGHIVDTPVRQFVTSVLVYTTERPLPDVSASDTLRTDCSGNWCCCKGLEQTRRPPAQSGLVQAKAR